MPSQRETNSENFRGDAKAPLPERRRRWIRLADAPLPGAAKTTLPRYEYGMNGEVTQTIGTLASDFQFAGMYYHAPSGLNLAVHRAYSPSLGRWISRDPIGESGGANLYAYVGNAPTGYRDPTGLDRNIAHQNCLGGICGTGGAYGIQPSPGQSLSSVLAGYGWVCKPQKCGPCKCPSNGPLSGGTGIGFTWGNGGEGALYSPWVQGAGEYHFMTQNPDGSYSGINGVGGPLETLPNPDSYDNGLGPPTGRYCCCKVSFPRGAPY
jgi:RHS repeat-associated protein